MINLHKLFFILIPQMIEYIQIQLAFKCGVHHQKLLKNSMRGEHGTQLPFGTQTKQDRKNDITQSHNSYRNKHSQHALSSH